MNLFLVLFLVWFFLFLAWGFFGSARIIHPHRSKVEITPDFFGLKWEPVALIADDGITIAGWFMPHPASEGALILLHGFGTSKADLLDIAKAFHEKGPFHLLMLDFRGHGDSGGDAVSFGFQEVLDVQAGLRFLKGRLGDRVPIGCYGVSMGGAVALLAAAKHPQIQAVAVDSTYADFARTVARRQWLTYFMPRWLFGQAAVLGAQIRLKGFFGTVSPLTLIGRISPRSVFFIHGTKDIGIPTSEVHALHRAAGDPKELWLVHEAEHAACFYKAKEEYPRRVMQFFRDAFLRAA